MRVMRRWPQIALIWQRCLNTEHHVSEGETWDQQLTQVALAAVEAHKAIGKPDWERVLKSIRQSQGPCIGDLPSHVSLCRRFGGGNQMSVIRGTLDFINSQMPAGRKISGNFLKAAADVPMSVEFQLTRLVHGYIKANATCPDEYVEDGTCKLISIADVKSLHGKARDTALHAEGVIQRVREVVAEPERDANIEVGEFEVKILMVVLDK